LTFIIIFPPFALGAADLYFEAILQLSILVFFYLYLVKSFASGAFEYRKSPLYAFFIFTIIYAILQILSGITGYRYVTLLSFKSVLCLAMLYSASNGIIDDRKKIDNILSILTLSGFCVSVIGIMQAFAKSDKIYWLIKSPNQNFFGTFVNENSFACYISIVSLVTLGSIFSSIYGWKKLSPGMPVKKAVFTVLDNVLNGKTLFKISAFSIMAYSIFISRSRSGMIFFAVSLAFYLVLLLRKNKALIVSAVLGMAGVYFLLIRFGIDTAMLRLGTVMGPDAYTGRAVVYEAGLKLFRDYPLFGIGLGSFSNIFPMYNYGMEMFFFQHLHNDILQLLIETGAVGFILISVPLAFFLAKFISSLTATSDRYKYCVGLSLLSSLFYLALHSLTDFQLRINAISSLAVIILALSTAVMGLGKPRQIIKIRPGLSFTACGILSAAVFIISSMLIMIPPAASMLSGSNTDDGMKLAMKLEPYNADNYLKYARFVLGKLDRNEIPKNDGLAAAEKALDKALVLNPYDGEYKIERAQIYYLRYDHDKAFSEMEKVILSEPNNPKAHFVYSYMLFWKAINESDAQEKGKLIKKGIVYYNRALALTKHTHLSSVIKDKMTYYLLKNALKEEGIEVE